MRLIIGLVLTCPVHDKKTADLTYFQVGLNLVVARPGQRVSFMSEGKPKRLPEQLCCALSDGKALQDGLRYPKP